LRIRSRYRAPIIVAWEGTDNFRFKLWPDYKRKRVEDATPAQEELAREVVASEGRLNELLSHAGVRQYYGIECEADDVIATLAATLQRKGIGVTIYTGDSDLRQLAGTGVTIMAPGYGGAGDTLYDYDAVVKRYGVRPRQLPAFKALAGDTSDGIPGLPGIGEKTASVLIERFGHLNGVISCARSSPTSPSGELWPVADRFRDVVKQGADKARLFLQLTTVKSDVRVKPVPRATDRDEVMRLLKAYKFRSLSSAAELLDIMRLGQ
jgi:DNA polymerase-1